MVHDLLVIVLERFIHCHNLHGTVLGSIHAGYLVRTSTRPCRRTTKSLDPDSNHFKIRNFHSWFIRKTLNSLLTHQYQHQAVHIDHLLLHTSALQISPVRGVHDSKYTYVCNSKTTVCVQIIQQEKSPAYRPGLRKVEVTPHQYLALLPCLHTRTPGHRRTWTGNLVRWWAAPSDAMTGQLGDGLADARGHERVQMLTPQAAPVFASPAMSDN